ncbi:hypothetical protein [Streptomyces sp. NPDC017988]|uniref:hypothetical protein n=1 Tax=Streptomyces sp. NPDC017988 TaxID=3365025 RepID=UPI0037B7ED66
MSENSSVTIVPVRLDALLLNRNMLDKTVQEAQPYYRRRLDFSDAFSDCQPAPLDHSDLKAGKDAGIRLHWQLPPKTLGRGRIRAEDGPAAGVTFPAAPNRWLVLRYYHPDTSSPTAPPQVAGRLVESDFTDDGTLATSPVAKDTWMGRHLDLSAETFPYTAAGKTKLTALGPTPYADLPTFAVFQPYCEDVFSLHDPLKATATSDAGTLAKGHLSYVVIGWHGDAGDEPAAALPELLDFYGDTVPHEDTAAFAELAAERLGWRSGALTTATHALYQGLSLGIRWNPAGIAPTTPYKPTDPDQMVMTAYGHETAEATATLVEHTLPAPPTHDTGTTGPSEEARQTAALLRAFHSGHLEDMDRAAGGLSAQHGLLATAGHRDAFTPHPSGTQWQVHSTTAKDPLTDAQYAAVRPRLAALNDAQQALDQAGSTVADARRQVADLWWLGGRWDETGSAYRPAGFDTKATAELDPTATGTAARALSDAVAALPALRKKVTDALQELNKVLPKGYEARPSPTAPYYSPMDPVVVLRGTGRHESLRPETDLPVRAPEEVLSGTLYLKKSANDSTVVFTVTAPTSPLLPSPHGNAAVNLLPDETRRAAARKLAGELYLLHALATYRRRNESLTDGSALHDAQRVSVAGTWPPETRAWQQPWRPLLLAWKITCYPLPHDKDDKAPDGYWTFNGTIRRLRTDESVKNAVQGRFGVSSHFFHLTGRSLLTPVPTFTLQGRIDTHHKTFPGEEAGFDTFKNKAGSWDLQSQTLTGVRAALARRAPAPARGTVPAKLVSLLAGAAGPWPEPRRGHHQLIPAAHLAIEQAVLLDTFGQAVTVLSTKDDKHLADKPYRARRLRPGYAVDKKHSDRFIELAPRLRQPARVALTPLAHTCTTGPDRVADPATDPLLRHDSPVGGWLLARHTARPDRFTLALYTPDGRALGELLRIGGPARPAVGWQSLPDSPLHRPEDVFTPAFAAAHPMLAGFATALLDRDADAIALGKAEPTDRPARLAALASAIDAGLLHTTYRPAVGTALAAGYPLALVRLRLHLELDGTPRTDPNWGTEKQGYGTVFTKPEKLDSAYLTRRWPVRLGTQADVADGLIGYYAHSDTPAQPGATDYHRLHTVHPVDGGGHYTRTITTGNHLAVPALPRSRTIPRDKAVYLTVLMDPRQALVAHTDLLPATTFRLPAVGVQDILDRMALSVPLGPALARTAPPAYPDEAPRLTLPAPSAAGHWAFAALEAHEGGPETAWHHYQLTAGHHQTRLEANAPQARHGYLTHIRPHLPHPPQEHEA